MLFTKERNVVYNKEKFSFKEMFSVIAKNDQLVVFMLFAMISNAGVSDERLGGLLLHGRAG